MQAERANAIGNSLKEEKNLFIDTRHYYYLITLPYHQSHCMRSLCSCMTKWKRKITKVYFNFMQTFTVEFQMISDATILVVLVLVTLSHLPSMYFRFNLFFFLLWTFLFRDSKFDYDHSQIQINYKYELPIICKLRRKNWKKPTKTFVYCFDIQ